MESGKEPGSASSERNGQSLPYGAPRRTWAGHGSGASCDVCHRQIRPDEVEYEVEMPRESLQKALHLHLRCYQDWVTEVWRRVHHR